MKKTIRIFWFSLMFLALAGSNNVTAQSFKATLTGQVTDSTGAVVPNATVTVSETATNQTQTVTTGEDGNYTFTQLTPGAYTLRVEAANFKTLTQTSIVLETSQSLRLNPTLEAGSISEQVTVTAEAPAINTETSSKGEVITPRQVQDLPLNGRNFTDLALLTPGVYRRPADDDQGEGLATSGTRTDASNFILDGTNNRNDRNSGVGVNTSVDSIQEFRVETSSYTAELGRTAGAQINVVTKSGTNRYSGSLFEYVRNDFFDAKNALAFDVPGTDTDESKKVLRRNQFGGTVGGPLPFLNFGEGGATTNSGRNRTFFFASYEGTRERRSATSINTAPNAAWARGDFRNLRGAGLDNILGNADDTGRVLCLQRSAPGSVVATRVECPTPNVIPFAPVASNPLLVTVSPIAQQILAFIPLSNIPGTRDGYVARGINRPDRNQYLAKFDHRFSDKNSFYIRFARQKNDGYQAFPSNRNFYPGFGRDAKTRSDTYAVSDTHIFSPSVINEARFGYFNQDSQNLGQNRAIDYNQLFGIQGVSPGIDLQGFPAIRIDGFSEFGDRPNDPFAYQLKTYQFFDSLSVISGQHNLKFGVDIIRSNYIENDVRNVRGDFRFRGRNVNPSGATSSGALSFADFLLGLPDTTSRQIGAEPADTIGNQYAFFAQDNWRATNWLTLNLGLRYEYQTALSEATGRLANLIINDNGTGTLVCPREVRSAATGATTCVSAASVGLPEKLVRPDKNNFGPRAGFALRPFRDEKTVVRGGAGIYYSLETFNPIRQQLAVQSPFLNRINYARNSASLLQLSLSTPFPTGVAEGTPRGLNPDYKQPEFYQYNLTIERQLLKDLVLEVGYVGSQGRHLGLRYNINSAVPTGTVTRTVAANGIITLTPDFARRFQAQYGTATIQYQDQFGNSSYNALQTSLRRRATNGLTLLMSYTFSKSIDTGSSTNNSTTGSQDFPQDIRNILESQRGLSDFHRAHQFNASFNYELPFGKGRGFFGDARGLTQTLVGGWQLNGIVTVLSGRPFTPQYSAADVGAQRPDVIGDPYANIPEGLLFNPAAFRRPRTVDPLTNTATGDTDLLGNGGRNILIGPKFRTVDLSLLKNIRLREKTRLQFRVETFNLFNTPNYQIPVFLLDNSNVGRVSQTATEGREFQFAVKLLF